MPIAAEEANGILCHEGILLDYVQHAIHQSSQGLDFLYLAILKYMTKETMTKEKMTDESPSI